MIEKKFNLLDKFTGNIEGNWEKVKGIGFHK